MASKVTKIALNDGTHIPVLGLGTWGGDWGETWGTADRRLVAQAVKDGIDIGYRHIDTALVYGIEPETGEAIAEKIKEGVVKREELYVVTKLWNTFHRADLVRGACLQSLKNLQLSYIDLYLIHWPCAHQEGDTLFPQDAQGNVLFSNADFVDTWREMEKLVDDGLVKSIGISNFNKRQIERLLASARIIPVTNQVEAHPYFTNAKLGAFCQSKGITLTAYSPLGTPGRPWAQPDEPVLLKDPLILKLSEKYKKSPAQILLRYHVEKGQIVIPKSANKKRLQENFDLFDFQISKNDLVSIEKLNFDQRYMPGGSNALSPEFPFNDEY